MAAKTLNQLVRDQILAEANQITDPDWRERYKRYIDTVLRNMSNVELLERISQALQTLTERSDPRQWL